MALTSQLDLDFVRAQFPAFALAGNVGQSFFDNAAGSYACHQTIDALGEFYTETKVQPYSAFGSSRVAGERMDRSRRRWAEALGVATDEVVFGPSTSMNTYVLAQAFGDVLGPNDEIIVTNQDHEANTGSTRRMAERVGATLREWRADPETGLLDIADFETLLTERTRLVTMPHVSNIVGKENDVARVCELAHGAGARVIVDGVSYVPHGIPDVAALGADVYLFSLYKVFSVHQGVMVIRRGLSEELPNQSHFFNASYPSLRLNPAGPDHAQVASAGAVLDYVETLHAHHGGSVDASLREKCAEVTGLWQRQEDSLTPMILDAVHRNNAFRLLGPETIDATPGHRCPTIAFSPTSMEPGDVELALVERGIHTSASHFYGWRVLEGMGVDPERGCVRLSFVHYTSLADVERLIGALSDIP